MASEILGFSGENQGNSTGPNSSPTEKKPFRGSMRYKIVVPVRYGATVVAEYWVCPNTEPSLSLNLVI